jgi:hypothetical protein
MSLQNEPAGTAVVAAAFSRWMSSESEATV